MSNHEETLDPELFIDLYSAETDDELIIKITHISRQFKPKLFMYSYVNDIFNKNAAWEQAEDLLGGLLQTVNGNLYRDSKIILAFYIQLFQGEYERFAESPEFNDIFKDSDFSFCGIAFTKEFLKSIRDLFSEVEIKTVGELMTFLNSSFNNCPEVKLSDLFVTDGSPTLASMKISEDKENVILVMNYAGFTVG